MPEAELVPLDQVISGLRGLRLPNATIARILDRPVSEISLRRTVRVRNDDEDIAKLRRTLEYSALELANTTLSRGTHTDKQQLMRVIVRYSFAKAAVASTETTDELRLLMDDLRDEMRDVEGIPAVAHFPVLVNDDFEDDDDDS